MKAYGTKQMRRKSYWTVPETADELGRTEKAIWHLIYRRRIPFVRWGRRVLIPVDKLLDFLDALPGASLQEARDRVEEVSGK